MTVDLSREELAAVIRNAADALMEALIDEASREDQNRLAERIRQLTDVFLGRQVDGT